MLVVLIAAQAASVQVTGTVRDAESGLPIAGAVVSFTDLHRVVRTDELGRYFLDAPPGTQRITVQRLGYASQSFGALVPPQGTLEINIELERDPIPFPPIEVRARVVVRGLESSDGEAFPDRSVSSGALYQHPLSPEPDALRAIGGGEVVLDPESPSGLHIRGGASDQVAYLIDGIPVFNPYHTAGTFGAWNADALSGLDLVTASPVPAAPDALSGVVSAHTRNPGSRLQTRGSVSATQARAVIDGPAGRTGVGYLFSAGSAFPGLVAHKDEASHINGENFDWLGKVESPLLGGRLRLLGCETRNEVDAATTVAANDTATVDPTRHELTWNSRSLGGEWSRPLGRASLLLRSWSARGNADAAWTGPDSLENLTWHRRDAGVVAMVELPALGGTTTAGVRAQRSVTSYALVPTSGALPLSLDVTTPVSTVFLGHTHSVTPRGEVAVSMASAFFGGDAYFSPSAQVRWQLAPTLMLSTTAARRHQFEQSLRNPESIVTNIFPADLDVGAGASGVPVARSDIGIVALEHRPNPWLRLGAQAYLRRFDALALVAPRGADPFAADGFVGGAGTAHGFSIEAGASRERCGILAGYSYQNVDLEYAGGHYVPDHGATHSLEAGVTVLPAPTYSIRLGFEGILGRRTTATLGSLEWEACNLLDEGCEFAGSPGAWSGPLGGTRLPAYFRLDLGVRKQWPVRVGERDGTMAVFGTATNLLGRKNVLTVAVDPSTGARSEVEMRPLSPLVVGLDWRF